MYLVTGVLDAQKALMAERLPYRGYDILPSHLQDAINEAKQAIDRALEDNLPAKVA
jgi:hypothetical protein